jgi:tripartite-type tricarboxylate transporter receptor subunit TctC
MTDFTRRQFNLLAGAAGLTVLAGCERDATGGAYPSEDITFIIPNGPGGNFDVFVRAVAPVMQKHLPRQVNIVPINVAAGGGGKGLADLYRARPDGYTIGIVNIPGAFMLQEQQAGRTFDLAEMTWLGNIAQGETYAIAVAPDSPIKTVADMQALSQQRPVKFTSTGPEGTSYSAIIISSEILGIRPQIITGYKGSNDYIVAAMRGDGDAALSTITTLRRFLAGGTVRVIATFEPQSSLPGVPDATTLGKPELSQIIVERMVAAPPGLPPEIKTVLQDALDKAVRDPEVMAWAKTAGHDWVPQSPADAEGVIRQQQAFFEKWKPQLLQRG